MRKLKTAVTICGLALVCLGGCKPDLSETKDEQLLQLLGSGGAEGAPA